MEKQTSYIGSNYSYTTFTQRANKTARNMVSVGTQTIKACIRVTISKSTLRNSINKMLKLQSKLNKLKNKLVKQSFNFKKRVGESHVLLHNLRVELFKCKHKMAFAGGGGG